MHLNNKKIIFMTIYKRGDNIFKLAFQNIFRRFEQSLITIIITIIAIFSIISVLGIYTTVKDGIQLSNERIGADIMLLPIKSGSKSAYSLYTADPSDEYINKKDLEFLADYPEIEKLTYQFFTNTIEGGCCTIGEKARIVGFDQNTDFILRPWLKQNGINLISKNQVIIGKDIDSIIGNKMSILQEKFNVIGSLYKTGSGLDKTLFVDIESARELARNKSQNKLFKKIDPEELVSSVFIKTSSGCNIDDFVNNINLSQNKVLAVSKAASVEQIESQISGLSFVGIFLIAALAISSMVSLFGRFNTLANSRKKEIGYLRILGVRKIEILKLITFETGIMGVIGGFIGSILAILFIPFFINILQSFFVFPIGNTTILEVFSYVLIGILISIILGFIAGLIPAIKISKLDPREIISKGEL